MESRSRQAGSGEGRFQEVGDLSQVLQVGFVGLTRKNQTSWLDDLHLSRLEIRLRERNSRSFKYLTEDMKFRESWGNCLFRGLGRLSAL